MPRPLACVLACRRWGGRRSAGDAGAPLLPPPAQLASLQAAAAAQAEQLSQLDRSLIKLQLAARVQRRDVSGPLLQVCDPTGCGLARSPMRMRGQKPIVPFNYR